MKVLSALYICTLASCLPELASAQATSQSITSPTNYNVALSGSAFAAAMNITSTTSGSGVDGEATAQDALNIKCHKTNFYSATTVGEVDCINVTLRQGGPNSSGSGMLVDAQNTGLGFVSDTDMVASSVNTKTNTLSMAVDIQEGVINKATAMYGAVYTAIAGAGNTAVLAQATGTASWTNVVRAVNSSGHQYYSVDGSGNSIQDGTARVGKSLYVNGIMQASATKVLNMPHARPITVADCGATVRSTFDSPQGLELPAGLPIGCQIDVIQAGNGAVLFGKSHGLHVEHTGARGLYETKERYAEAQILVDSSSTFLLTGEVSSAQTAFALASYEPDGTPDRPDLHF